MRDKYLLVFDAGTGAGRCSIFDLKGSLAAVDYCEWNYVTPYENKEIREFIPADFWEILSRVARGALAKAGIDPNQVIGVTSTSQREGVVIIDKGGQEIYAGPNIDFRGEVQGKWLHENFGPEMYEISGHWPSAMTAPARLLWFKEHKPHLYKRMHALMMINDWILYRLTGEVASEPSNACETLFFNIHTMAWDYDLIDKLGVNPMLFPKILRSGDQLGLVSEKAAAATGLKAGTPVFMGGADTQCALLATGGLKEGHTAIVSGTSTPVQAVVKEPLLDGKARVRTGCYLPAGSWVIDSNARPTGVVYRWLRDTFYANDCAGAADLYEVMNKEAAAVPPGSEGLVAFGGPSILNVSDQRDFPNMFFGIKPGYEKELCRRGLFARSILENIAFAVRGNIEQIYDLLNYKPPYVYMTGGAAKSALQLEIMANVLGLPIHVAQGEESTSLGAAICGAVGAGVFADFDRAVAAMVRPAAVVEPRPLLTGEYEKHYRRWKKLYDYMTENINALTNNLN
ncbi:MAG TPA: hypothetical protein GX528_08640 [Firmicutes bacterium]|nr:hypothetical protein [Bacillota bacterium]